LSSEQKRRCSKKTKGPKGSSKASGKGSNRPDVGEKKNISRAIVLFEKGGDDQG